MDLHERAMTALCRVCGRRNRKHPESRKKTGLKKEVHKERLLNSYQLNITSDITGVHPQYICLSCVASFGKGSLRPVVGWTPHSELEDCQTCSLMLKKGLGFKAAVIAATRRKAKQAAIQEESQVDAACDIILNFKTRGKKKPTKKLQKVASAVLKRLLENTGNDVVELPTGGPRLTVKKVVKPKVASNKASKRTVRERAKRLIQDIEQASCTEGSSPDAADVQFAALLLRKSKKELHALLKKHGLLQIRIPAGHELAMKARLGWSWAEMRQMKQWLKAYHIFMVCEGKTRRRKAKMLGDDLQREMLPFMFKEGDEHYTKLAPLIFIKDLPSFILKKLDELDKADLLVWNSLPEEEVWIKIGGDKGGGTTKFYFQVVNVAKANSLFNTTCFCVYAADETTPNLHIALDRFVDQVNSLQDINWRGKSLKVWLCGDYEIERKLLGMQGASATYPCTHCRVSKDDLSNQDDAMPRTLTNIKEDFDKVKAGNFTAGAKKANHNISNQPFFNTPVDQICPPGLHISLGLWHKFYTNLEHDLQELGQLIAEYQAKQNGNCSDVSFEQHVTKTKTMLQKVQVLEQQSDEARQKALDLEYELMTQALFEEPSPNQQQMMVIEDLYKQAKLLENQARDLRKENKLENEKNPLIQRLDSTLQSFKVRRQAFYSKSFVDNHVDKCLQTENYTRLLQEVVDATKDLCTNCNTDMEDLAVDIQLKYMLLFEKFRLCHKTYNTSSALQEGQIQNLKENIDELVEYYKIKFRNFSFTPKFHILYKHVIPFIQRTGVGLGRMAEQGGEQLHRGFNILERRLQGVRNVKGVDPHEQLLLSMMEEHLIRVHPATRKILQEE